MSTVTLAILYFLTYSFCGWLFEVTYLLVTTRKLNLDIGYLTLPILPIYGFSALAILCIVQPYIANPFWVFMATAGVVTIIELLVSTALDKIFHIRLWSYDDMPFNFQGKVSVPTSLGFGIVGLFLVYILHPFLSPYISGLPVGVANVVVIIILVVVAIDTLNSTITLAKIRYDNRRIRDSFDGVMRLVENRIREARKQHQKARFYFQKFHRANIQRLRRAFPDARTTKRRKR